MLSEKTTNYFGAGARVNALPLAKDTKKDLYSFLNLLDPQNGISELLQKKFSY